MSIKSMIDNSWPPRIVDLREFVWARVVASFSATIVLLASYTYAPFVNKGLVLCPVHGLLGLPCPSCGLTRAFCCLAHLDILGALYYHALSLPLFLVFLATPAICMYEILRRKICWLHSLVYSHRVAYGVGVLLAAYHAVRVSIWLFNGTLVDEYLTTSWTFAGLRALGVVGT
jgi:uncharacterized protein DUF2752